MDTSIVDGSLQSASYTETYYFGVAGSSGYLVVDDQGDGYDAIIQLLGVTNIAATDIIIL